VRLSRFILVRIALFDLPLDKSFQWLLNSHRLEMMNGNFQTTLQRFESVLPIVLTKLKFAFFRHENRQPILI
jgi:hypothetical protein